MTPKKIPFNYDINRMEAVDLVSIIHIDDYDTRFLELILSNEGSPLNVDGCTVTARFVTAREKYLLRDDVPCEAVANTITIPIDAAAVDNMACDIKIEVNIVDGEKILTLPFPLWIRVRGSILDDAQITPESEGTIPDLLKAAQQALEAATAAIEAASDYENMDNKPQINSVELVGDKSGTDLHLVNMFHVATEGGEDECTENGVLYYASFAGSNGFIICRNNYTQLTQFGWTLDGRALWRTRQGETPWQPAEEWSEWAPTGGAGVTDYNDLTNKPKIFGGGLSPQDLVGMIYFEPTDFYNQNIDTAGGEVYIQIRDRYFGVDFSIYETVYDFNNISGIYYHAGMNRFVGASQTSNFPANLNDIDRTKPYYVVHYTNKGNSDSSWIVRKIIGFNQNGDYVEYAQLISIQYPVINNAKVVAQTTWQKISGGSQIVSGVVNQNGTITFTDSDGNTFTTTGSSVIGPQGVQGATGSQGPKGDTGATGPQGPQGDDYVLTNQDKTDIANIVLQLLPNADTMLFPETSEVNNG